jgi:hypothetical protein
VKIELTEDGKDRLKDFVRFGKHLKSSSDIDPLYPILRSIIVQHKMTEEQAYWFTFLYVAWYNVAVGYRAWLECPEPDPDILTLLDPTWPTGVERRASRGGRVREHIDSFLTAADGYRIQTWFNRGLNADAFELEDQHANWRILNERLQTLRMNGRWAAYKHCEVLRRVHYVMVQAPDMGNQFSSGPREGLAFLYGELEGQGPKLSRAERVLLPQLVERIRAAGLSVPLLKELQAEQLKNRESVPQLLKLAEGAGDVAGDEDAEEGCEEPEGGEGEPGVEAEEDGGAGAGGTGEEDADGGIAGGKGDADDEEGVDLVGLGFGGEGGREVFWGGADGLAGLLEPDGEAEKLGELVGHLFTPGEGGLVEEGGVCLGEGGEGDAVFAFGEAFEDGDEHEGPEQGEGDDAERQPGGRQIADHVSHMRDREHRPQRRQRLRQQPGPADGLHEAAAFAGGADRLTIKRHGNWKSDAVDSYIQVSTDDVVAMIDRIMRGEDDEDE